jgi:uncharacterized protein YjeT (DUF2065 family)
MVEARLMAFALVLITDGLIPGLFCICYLHIEVIEE